MLTELCSDLGAILHLNRQYRNCIRLMALSIVLVCVSAMGYAVTLNPCQLFPFGLSTISIVFAYGEIRHIEGIHNSYTEPVLREIAPMGKTKDIGNPDRMIYALEISLLELEHGYLVSRAAHNINIIIARLLATKCCANAVATKFYRVFTVLYKWRPSEYICGMWLFSIVFPILVFLHAVILYGQYSFIGGCLFGAYAVALSNTKTLMNNIFRDLHMARLYYNSPEKHGDSFAAYADTRFMDASDETV